MSAVITSYRVCNRCEDFNVGYQTTSYTNNGDFTVAVATFAKADGSTITLKDLKVVGGDYTKNAIQFLDRGGTTAKFSYTDEQLADLEDYYGAGSKQKENEALLFYINEEDAVGMECTAGWYAKGVDDDCIVNLNECDDFDVSFGRGYYYMPVIAEAQFQYNGEVVKGDSELSIPVTGDFTLTGNCSPTDFDLGYFKVNGGDYTKNVLQFLGEGATTATFSYTDGELADLEDYYGAGSRQKVNEALLFYINEDDAPGMECTPGWYAKGVDDDCIVNISTRFTVKSGEGFYFNPVNSDVKLVIPGAIE